MVLSDGLVYFLKIENFLLLNPPKLSCGFKYITFNRLISIYIILCLTSFYLDFISYVYGANDLAIPDTHCNLEREGNDNYRQCPHDMVCKHVPLNHSLSGYNSFRHIGLYS